MAFGSTHTKEEERNEMTNIDITKTYQTRDRREVVIFEISDKVYCKIKEGSAWFVTTRALCGRVNPGDPGASHGGDLITVRTWRAWKQGEAPRYFIARRKITGEYSVVYGQGNLPSALFSHYEWVHEDGTTTPCGVEE